MFFLLLLALLEYFDEYHAVPLVGEGSIDCSEGSELELVLQVNSYGLMNSFPVFSYCSIVHQVHLLKNI